MVLVLALGDLDFPHRAADVPAKLKSMLVPGKIHYILSPGNLCIKVVPWGNLDSLAMLQRQLDVDILITGHTHQFKAYKHEGGVIINPGSPTGAYSTITYDVNPSFVLMDVDGSRVVVYVYELVDGEAKVDKSTSRSWGIAFDYRAGLMFCVAVARNGRTHGIAEF